MISLIMLIIAVVLAILAAMNVPQKSNSLVWGWGALACFLIYLLLNRFML